MEVRVILSSDFEMIFAAAKKGDAAAQNVATAFLAWSQEATAAKYPVCFNCEEKIVDTTEGGNGIGGIAILAYQKTFYVSAFCPDCERFGPDHLSETYCLKFERELNRPKPVKH